ncbi:cytidylyltransferase domain-containing protein [Helicobacter rodentium]|uniref:acylneuraminate cytidylyltransferase family protein n=1 Tax=Helicobacter rodentium TaxID=59617 RepID=UPI002353F389|nr:acylneuraminate cytidylyltransferase family protein [Helicobacter rodentium]
MDTKTFLAIIPARSGSKRLKDKNIKILGNKPLLAWSIESALNSKYVNEVVVTTDSEHYANIAQEYGANTPFLRPQELSRDCSSSFEAIKHTILFYRDLLAKKFDYTILLQPTSPLRKSFHIDEACELLLQNNKQSIISVTPCEHSPLWTNTLPQNHSMDNFLAQDICNTRSQDLPTYYRLNGAIYIANTDILLKKESFFIKDSMAYCMDNLYSIDIDTELDFAFAEFLIHNMPHKFH